MLMAGMSAAVWTAATMVQGCGSDAAFNQINNTSNPGFPADQGNGNVNNPVAPVFVQPVVLRSSNGLLDTTLQTKFALNQVGGVTLNLRSYNGQLTGPTLRVKPGDTLRILVDNQLPANPDAKPANINQPHQLNTTNLHTHGLHVSPQGNSDNIFVEIDPGAQFQYEYHIPANHPPGTLWYHPHKHGSSSVQLISGMAGALIIEGGLDDVPAIKQARDLVYLITELNVDNTNAVPTWSTANSNPFALNQRKILVNGRQLPTLQAFSGEVVRLRVINGCVRTAVPFGITGHTLNVISLDGIALPSMRQVNEIVLPPAGRADILVRCGAPGNYDVVKGNDTSVSNADPLVNIGVLTVLNTVVTMQLPDKLPPQPYANITDAQLTSNVVTQLTFEQNSAEPAAVPFQNFTIDQKHFNPNVVNQSVPLNSVLEWELINNSPNGHPFHIHINPFMVTSVNNVALPEPEWHDTFNIPKNGRIRIRHRFEDFKGLYVLHCHILVHEDLGMMQTVNVT
jgi:FtsP/CotA-like multicopper oxidase with cupredoxin domain